MPILKATKQSCKLLDILILKLFAKILFVVKIIKKIPTSKTCFDFFFPLLW